MNNTGGERGRGGMAQTVRVKFDPRYPRLDESQASRTAEFRDLLSGLARLVRSKARTPAERYVCDGVRKGTGLSIAGLETLCELAARSETPLVLEEFVRGQVLRRMPLQDRCVAEAYRAETERQASHDVVQARYMAEKSETWRQAAIREGTQALHALRHWLDTLHVIGFRSAP